MIHNKGLLNLKYIICLLQESYLIKLNSTLGPRFMYCKSNRIQCNYFSLLADKVVRNRKIYGKGLTWTVSESVL